MAKGRRVKYEETDIQLGIMLGADWPIGDIARHLGVTSQAISMRKQRDREGLIPTVAAWTKIAISKYIETRIRQAEEDLGERKKRLHKKGYRVIEKTLDHALDQPDEIMPDQVHLRAAEMGIERTEGTPLDRKAILSREEHIYRFEVDGADVEQLITDVAQINEMRQKQLPPQSDPPVEQQ